MRRSVGGRHIFWWVAAVVALSVTALPAQARADVRVYFLQGEQMSAVTRPGSTVEDAARQLLAGPTDAETARGLRDYVPEQTQLRSVAVTGDLATVDLNLAFVTADKDPDSLRARVAQLVYTLTGPQGVKRVQLELDGGTPLGVVPGIVTSRPLTEAYLAQPDVRAPKVPPATPPSTAPARPNLRAQQQRLIDLGYLIAGDADGKNGPATQAAVMAFQKYERLARDGVIGPKTAARLNTASRPVPATRGPAGRRAEVLLDRQVALAIENNQVVRAIHVSTGASATPTPTGTFRVYAQFTRWWSTPFREWLLWASPFNGGIAFHQLADVPAFPASHGCVRITAAQARWMYDFLDVGDQVKVLARS